MADVFELETDIDYSAFSSLRGQLANLKSVVGGWQMANEDPSIDKDPYGCCGEESEGWTLDMNGEKSTVENDLAICIERIDNITKAINCVIQNHRGLQESCKFNGPSVRRYHSDGSLNLPELEKVSVEQLK